MAAQDLPEQPDPRDPSDPLAQAGLTVEQAQQVHQALARLALAEASGQQDLQDLREALALRVLHPLRALPVQQALVLVRQVLPALAKLALQGTPACRALLAQLAELDLPVHLDLTAPRDQPVIQALRAFQGLQAARDRRALAERQVQQARSVLARLDPQTGLPALPGDRGLLGHLAVQPAPQAAPSSRSNT